MANYYLNDDGTLTQKKKKNKGNNYMLNENGTLVLIKDEEEEAEEAIAPVTVTPEKEERKWFEKGLFSDGYNFGDVSKTFLGSYEDLNTDIVAGAVGMGEKAVDAGATLIGGIGGFFGADKFQDKMKGFVKKDLYDETKVAEKLTYANPTTMPIKIANKLLGNDYEEASVWGNKTDSLAQSAGQLGATVGLQALGVPWFVTTGTTSFGGEAENAFKNDATYGEAVFSGAVTAGLEVGLEKLSGGISFGGKTLDTGLKEILTSKIGSKTAKLLAKFGFDMAGEGTEEVLTELGSTLGQKLSYEDEKTWEELFASEEAMDGYLEAFIGGAVLGGGFNVGKVANSLQTGRDYDTGLTENEQKVIDKEVENRIAEKEADGTKLNKKDKANIEEAVKVDMQKGNISIDVIESVLGGKTYENYKSMTERENTLKKEIEALENMPREQITVKQGERLTEARKQLESLEKLDTKTQLKEKLSKEVDALTEKDTFLRESYNEKTRRSQAFEADLTKYDAKQQEVIKKAQESGILNNTNKTHDFVDMVAKLSADKGVLFDFTNNEKLKESGFAIEGKTVNGYVKDGNIALNINSNKALNTVVGHEITHILEGTDLYTELQTAVKEYATTKGEYDSRLQELSKLYEGVDNVNIENELTADLVGDYLFTDSDFISNLSTQKPNIFKKIYEEIKYLYKLATAGSKEARELEKVKKAFDKAYKESASTTTENKAEFSLNELPDGKRFVEVDQEQDRFEGHDRSEYPQIAKEIINEKFVGKVVGIDNKMFVNGRGRDEFTHPSKPIKEDYVYDAKMKASAEIDNLLDAGTNFRNEADGRDGHVHENITGGFDYYDTLFKVGDNYFEATVNIGNTNKGKLFKDVTKIKDVTKAIMNSYGQSPKFQFLRTSSIDSIPQNQENTTENAKSTQNEDIAPTKEQEEYFKDSVVRDENGKLKVMYHGTSKGGHTVFDPYGASKYGLFGVGSYFTDNKSVAESYTEKGKGNNKQIYEAYLNITNPIDMDAQANPEAWKKAFPEADFPESGTNEDFYRAMEEYMSDNEYSKYEASETALEVLESMGYDGITHIGGGRFNKADDTRHQVYIAFQPEQIKNIDNTNPTTDADIRYSLSADSEGHTLSEEQRERFKDSKVVDDNGNLKVVYHGSPADFDTFSLKYLGTNGTNEGYGFYFTDKKEIAQGYANGTEAQRHQGANGKLFEVYLDIKKPLSDTEVTMTRAEFKKFLKELDKQVDEDGEPLEALSNYGDVSWEGLNTVINRVMEVEYDGSDSDVNMIHSIINGTGNMEIVFDTLRKTTGYDGIIVRDAEWGGDQTIYVAFHPEQIKSVDNKKPTNNPNINLSLSKDKQNIAPTGNYNVYGKDIALETVSKTENVAPLVKEKTDLVQDVVQDEYAPITDASEIDEQQGDRLYSLTEKDMPEEAPTYEDFDDIFGGTEEVVSPFDSKDIQEVGDRKQKAYMYENPEVKPYFQEEAQIMLGELRNSIKGERVVNADLVYESGGEFGVWGTKRETSEQIAYMLDRFKYTYADIEKGLNAIIEDHGAENNAISKRLEFMIDERLREGYTDFVSGMEIPSNQDYINLLSEKQINAYSDEAYNQYLESLANEAPTDQFRDTTKMTEDIAPTKEYEAIEPKPQNLDTLEAQWAKNKMSRVDSNKKAEFEEIAKILDAEPVTENDRNNRKWAIFKANVLDKGAVFEDLSLKTKNRDLIGKWNYTLYSEARAQRLMGEGDTEAGIKSLNDIRAEVENTGLTHQFYEYMYHKHNVDRMSLEAKGASKHQTLKKEIERLGLDTLSEKQLLAISREGIKDSTTPEREHLINTVKEYLSTRDVKNKPVFGYSVTAEMSQEIVDQYEFAQPEFMDYANDVYNYQNYLRQQLVDSGVISQETADLWSDMYPHYVPIRRVDSKGNNINVPLDTGRTGVNAPIKKATGGNTNILPLFDTMAMRTLQTYKATAKNSFGVELKNTLGTTVEKGDTNIDDVIDSIDTQESLLQEGKKGQKPTFTVFENGERVTFEITEDMYDAFKPLSNSSFMSKTVKPLNVASNFHRGLLTEYNPVFILTNGIKDIQDVLINSQHAVKTYLKMPEAFAQLTTKGYWYNEYMNNGGDSNSYFDSDTNTFKTENKGIAKVLDLPPLSTISKLNNYVEMIPRLAEYIASRESGRSIEVSMLDSARVTTNFRAGGDLTKFLNRNGATFLNASVQGAMQQVRNIREAKANGMKGWANLATKFAIAGAPAFLLNALLWDDDEEYEELSDYVKQNYYIVGKYGDGQFIRIPKGRTVAVIQDALKQISDVATGNDEADLKSFLQLVVTNLAPANPIENNILAPIIQVKNNETWYGEDLVPTRLQDLPASEQYDESTDKFSKWLGGKLDISPVKINYLLDQYSGGLGDVVLPMMTPEAESGDNSVVGNIIAPLKKKFTVDSTMNNQNVSDFYEISEELTTEAKKSTATDEDVLKNKYINSVKAEMSDLYKQKREIQNSDLPDDEKYEQVHDIQSQIVALSKEGLGAYEKVTISGDYATVGDRHYKKNAEGEWSKLTDKQLEKQEEVTAGLGISASDYWSNKDEYDYAYESPEKYAISKALGGYDTYKGYTSELNDIKADKDEEGKTISGSRKAKVENYINGLEADYGEKILLFKSEYPADDTYNEDIIEYLNNRNDISYEEMVAILKELDFTVEADGTIRW